jgi:hypothetical protein
MIGVIHYGREKINRLYEGKVLVNTVNGCVIGILGPYQ